MKSFFWRRKKSAQTGGIFFNLIFLCFIAVFCIAVYLARRPLLRFAAEAWIINEPLQHADTLIVLSDDNFYGDRATRAAELYRQGVAPLVLVSGRRLRPYAGIGELIEHDLIERGVPKENIVVVPHLAANTKEEAPALAKVAAERHCHSVIVVTSNYHTRRARYIFRREFPPDIAVQVAAAQDSDFAPDHWWETRIGIKRFAEELVGMVVSMWELRGQPVHTAQFVIGFQAIQSTIGSV